MTDVPLLDHVRTLILASERHADDRAEAIEDRVNIRLDAIKEAILMARDDMNRRLEGMNELRAAMQDQVARFATREFVEGIDARVQELRVGAGDLGGRRAGTALWTQAIIASGLVLLGAVLSYWLR